MSLLTKTSLILTLSYFSLWCFGPLWLSELGNWYGLPLWFWFSCIGAPLLLIVSLSLILTRFFGTAAEHND
ncbi:DUF997 family protein [Shewanella schlegeliana]|uniref:DUF997 family protein n=1 Tax=Shewanella schlegeliana TaxID=190308 RepID=A0ABS1SXL1_9GAMM|nr:DUF997 family protein [Shewanella schlegeliana]MBL4913090.1 DUF997 family protein [Shewanella schlegeliana]MCL1111104.1 DUF997 family protein [Shewanella schlegeliana]